MIRYFVILHRRSGTSHAEFMHAWTGEHAALAGALPGVLQVSMHEAIDGADFDGIGCLDFVDEAALRACLDSPEAKVLRAHTATFADPDRAQRFVVQLAWMLKSPYGG